MQFETLRETSEFRISGTTDCHGQVITVRRLSDNHFFTFCCPHDRFAAMELVCLTEPELTDAEFNSGCAPFFRDIDASYLTEWDVA